MAYDEQLADRIRQVVRTRSDITERKRFGGLASLCLGPMCCGINGRDLMVRIPDDEFDAVMRNKTGNRHRNAATRRGRRVKITAPERAREAADALFEQFLPSSPAPGAART